MTSAPTRFPTSAAHAAIPLLQKLDSDLCAALRAGHIRLLDAAFLRSGQLECFVRRQDLERRQAETGERYAFCNRRVDAIGRRYADGFHSSASDPSLKAKYGNAKADYSHLPPPPTFGAPPPPPPPASY